MGNVGSGCACIEIFVRDVKSQYQAIRSVCGLRQKERVSRESAEWTCSDFFLEHLDARRAADVNVDARYHLYFPEADRRSVFGRGVEIELSSFFKA